MDPSSGSIGRRQPDHNDDMFVMIVMMMVLINMMVMTAKMMMLVSHDSLATGRDWLSRTESMSPP